MSGRNIIGWILVIVGLLLVFQLIFQDFNLKEIFSLFWPIIFVFLGLLNLFRFRQTSFVGFSFIFIGIFFMLRNLGLLPEPLHRLFWPLFIIISGIWILLSSLRNKKIYPTKEDSSNDLVNYTSIMSGTEARVVSKNFRGGSATAIMGSTEIDLRNAQMLENSATMDLTAIMGGYCH